MDDRHKRDTLCSHRILNLLRSGYHGELTFMRTMRELGSPEITDESIQRLQTTIQRIDGWYDGLGRGDCLFSASWTTPQTFDAKKAIEFLDQLKIIVERSSSSLRDVIALQNWNSSKSETRKGISHVARYAYSLKTYSAGLYDFASLMQDQELFLRIQTMASHEEQFVARATAAIVLVRGQGGIPSELEKAVSADMRYAANGLAGQVHDVVQILAPYKGGEAFILATFNESEAQEWRAIGVHPLDAGYWRAFEFTPKVARQWIEAKIFIPGAANIWMYEGFAPDVAARWISLGLSPAEARVWEEAGYAFENAAPFIKRGFRSPGQLPKGD